MITAASFRADLPEFANKLTYLDSVISYWIAVAQIMMGIQGAAAPQVVAFKGSILGNTLTVNSIDFGAFSLLPLLLSGQGLPANALVLNQITGPAGGTGTYNLNFAANIALQEMVGLQNVSAAGANPYWGAPAVAATSPPTTLVDLAMEWFVAHNLVLEKQAIDQANSGGDPGTRIGVVSSKSVGGVSVSYDVSQIVDLNSGFWGQTTYGLRFIRMARLRGMGPVQIGIGVAPPFLFFNSWGLTGSYNAWVGPPPGPAFGESGF